MIRHPGIQGREALQEVLVAGLGALGQQQQLFLLLDPQLHRQQVVIPGGPAREPAQIGQREQLYATGLQRLHAVAGRFTTEQMVEVDKLVPLPVELLDVLAPIRQHHLGPQQALLHLDQQIRAVTGVPEAGSGGERQGAGKREEARGLLLIHDPIPAKRGSVHPVRLRRDADARLRTGRRRSPPRR
ncbi:hypothetical protein D3C84_301670 [compost metagenome]